MEHFSCLPWVVSTTGERPKVVDGAGMGVCHMTYAPTWAEQNARRIVACVNACDGIPTDLLEDAKCWAEAGIASVASLREQQVELVESLRWALRRIETAGLGQGEYFAKADAVLAKAEIR